MRIAISGSSGFIGSALTHHLRSRGDEVVALKRPLDPSALDGADAVVNLAGAGIANGRWNSTRRAEIRNSRVDSTTTIARALGAPNRPKIMISGSAIGLYGDRGDEVLTESSPPVTPPSFLSEVVTAWEAATLPAREAQARVALCRTGIVLGPRGGALAKMLLPFRLGLGGRIGSGRQWWSWISLADEVRAIVHLLDHDLSGPFNLTAPNPVRNSEFAAVLGRALHRPALLPLPAALPRAALGTELAHELLLSSTRALPAALTEAGFEFEHPELSDALRWALDT